LAIDEDEQIAGGLNIYAREPHAFDEDSRSAATRFAPCAAVAAGNLHAYRSAVDRADDLQTALETRGVIDQAKGILMGRHKLTAEQAFQVLAQMSLKTNRKLRAVADDLVHTGELPQPVSPPAPKALTRPRGGPAGPVSERRGLTATAPAEAAAAAQQSPRALDLRGDSVGTPSRCLCSRLQRRGGSTQDPQDRPLEGPPCPHRS
jgi:ANTAR domain-containing protein